MDPLFFSLGSLLGALSVGLGAFGAHGLRSRMPPDRLDNFETAARYQMYHALALLGASFAAGAWPGSALPVIAGWLFAAGILLFCGSLYLLVFTGQRMWGAVTPLGGLAFIAGWICLVFAAWRV